MKKFSKRNRLILSIIALLIIATVTTILLIAPNNSMTKQECIDQKNAEQDSLGPNAELSVSIDGCLSLPDRI